MLHFHLPITIIIIMVMVMTMIAIIMLPFVIAAKCSTNVTNPTRCIATIIYLF